MFVLGGYQSDFAVHLSRSGREIGDLVGECIDGALAAADLDAAEIHTIHVGNAFGQLFNGQGQLGAMAATVRPALWGVPAVRHEAACASGTIAILAAQAELAAGYYDVALVIGVEQERCVDGETAARHLGAAAYVGHEGQDARYLWPHMFSRVADAYAERWGLEHRHLDAISAKNFANAKANPNAQTRTWTYDPANNPPVEGRLRRLDCAQVTDGGAAIVLASPRYAEAWATKRARALPPRILGWGLRTTGLALDAKLDRSRSAGGLLVPHVADAVTDARRRAGRSIAQIDAYEVHDCFSITEYLAIDHLGLTPVGESWRHVEDPRVPINRSGGLIGGGHPVGATGVRMAVDAARFAATDGQTVQTLNIGGSATTVASLVIGPG